MGEAMKRENEKTRRRRLSIRSVMTRMLVAVCALFAVLCLLISAATQRILLRNASEHQQLTGQKLKSQLEMVYDKMDVYAMNICLDENVRQLMIASNAQRARYVDSVLETLATYMIMEPALADIALVNAEVHYSRLYDNDQLDRIRAENLGDAFRWNGTRASSFRAQADRGQMLLYTDEIKLRGADIGTLILTFDPAFFQLGGEDSMGAYYLLADDAGVIFPFNCEAAMAQEIWALWSAQTPDSEGDSAVVAGNRYIIGGQYSDKMRCSLLSTLDERSIGKNMRSVRLLIWLMVLLAFGFMAGLFALMVHRMVKPLDRFRQIIRSMRQDPRRETTAHSAEALGGCLEIEEIGHEFAAMVDETDQLNRQVMQATTDLYEAKVAKQQAELSYMRSQIDPHFLYNTLEVFRRKALEKSAPELAEMAMDMGRIFRYSTKGEDQVRLSEEMAIVKSYIHLQKMRFQDRFKVFYAIAEDTLSCMVAKMLIQPLAENAIAHGIEPKEEAGTLFIASRIEGDALIITVKDDGIGIPPERLREIQMALESGHYDTSEHVGILNTHARIRLQYGAAYGLTIDSAVGDGTSILLRLPIIRQA